MHNKPTEEQKKKEKKAKAPSPERVSTEGRSQGASSGDGMTAAIIDTSVHFKKLQCSNNSHSKCARISLRNRVVHLAAHFAAVAESEKQKRGAERRGWDSSVCVRVPSELYKPAGFPSMLVGRWEKAVSITLNLSTD